MEDDFDMKESGEEFDSADMGADAATYAPQKEGEERQLTSDGGVKKLIKKAGDGWDKPETGDEVKVHYTGTLLDGTKFDSSVDRNEPFTFKLGQGQVIKGWDVGVASMKKGEKALLTISSDYAYGDSGSPPKIPGKATLQFEVELLSWVSVKDICGDGGIWKKVVKEGKKYEKPKADDEVHVVYEARIKDGPVIGKSAEEGEQFILKNGLFCLALEKAIGTMHKEESVLLTVKPQYGFGEEGRPASGDFPAVPPNATLEISVELKGWKKVERVTPDGKVMKKILKEGEGYERPNEMAKVKVRYTAKLADGTVFEKKGEGEGNEFEFIVDEEQVPSGLDQAIMKMKGQEIALITIAADYGFKDEEYKGELATVPPNSTIQYELELVSFIKEKESWDMDTAEKIETAGKRKAEGNDLFKVGKYAKASKKYNKAAKLIEYDSQYSDEEKKQSKPLLVSCYLNDAACNLKLKEYKEAIKLCTKVLEKEPLNVKALYRRAQAYSGTADYDLAELDLKKALEIDANSREVRLEYKQLKQRIAEQNKKEAKLYGNMFARLNKLEEKEVKAAPKKDDKAAESNGTAAETEEQPTSTTEAVISDGAKAAA